MALQDKIYSLLDRFGLSVKDQPGQSVEPAAPEIDKEALQSEQAGPSMTGIRSIISNQVTAGINPQRLARILRASEEGDSQAYLEMAEEIEEKDAHYMAVMGTRKRAVAQMDITVEAASNSPDDIENANIIKKWLQRDTLESEIFDMLDAIGKGFSVTELIWDTGSLPWLPKKMIWRNPSWFQFDRNDGHTLRLRDGTSINGVDLQPYKYIVHRHASKSGLTIRSGVARPCAWMWLFKNFSVKDWVIFTEAYGQPIRIGKYHAGASKEDRDVLMRAVANIGSDAAAIIPDSMIIEFIESQGKTGTVDAFERLCKFCDEQMSKAVLGQTTTTDALSSGLAGNASHNDVRGDISRSDAKQLAATLNEQLIPAIIILNKGPRQSYPHVNIGSPEPVDLEKLSVTADRAVRMGMKVSHKGMMDKLGLPAAENDEDAIKLPETAAPPAGFGQGFASAKPGDVVTAAAAVQRQPDMIDALADDMSKDWEEIMNPIVAEIEAAIQDAETFEELNTKLLDVIAKMKMDPVVEKVARAIFAARIAGNLELDLSGK